jgi:hypothetical protein
MIIIVFALAASVTLNAFFAVEIYYAKREAKSLRHSINLLTRY